MSKLILNNFTEYTKTEIMSQYFGHICVILGLCIVLVNGAPQNSNPTASPLSVQNPLTSSDSAVSKEKKIQEKRFSDLKAGFLNK